jgi:hypothetical protein
MFVVRYVALGALVVLLSASVPASGWFGAWEHSYGVAAIAAAIVLTALFVMKFVGPPPKGFVIRAIIAFLVVAISLYASQFARGSTAAAHVNLALGLVLLAWYARE